jgi:hypothetical protein
VRSGKRRRRAASAPSQAGEDRNGNAARSVRTRGHCRCAASVRCLSLVCMRHGERKGSVYCYPENLGCPAL